MKIEEPDISVGFTVLWDGQGVLINASSPNTQAISEWIADNSLSPFVRPRFNHGGAATPVARLKNLVFGQIVAVVDRHVGSPLVDNSYVLSESLVILGVELGFLGYSFNAINYGFQRLSSRHPYLKPIVLPALSRVSQLFSCLPC